MLEERGEVDVKGKGMMRTWYLVGQQEPKSIAPESNSVQRRSGTGPEPDRLGSYITFDRNALVRSCCGLLSTSRGAPLSTITPPSMNTS